MLRVTRIPHNSGTPQDASLREFMKNADVCQVPRITRLANGHLWIHFTGRDRSDDWSFWLGNMTLTEWLRLTGAQLYRWTFLPKNSHGISVVWPSADIDSWNRAGKGTWEYSLLPASEPAHI